MINYYSWAVYCEGPPSFIQGEGGAKNEGLLFQSTIDVHILNIFQLTVDIHFQNTLLLPLSLLLCSLLLPNCEGSHSVRLFTLKAKNVQTFNSWILLASKLKYLHNLAQLKWALLHVHVWSVMGPTNWWGPPPICGGPHQLVGAHHTWIGPHQ